jgi:hypothetical protein
MRESLFGLNVKEKMHGFDFKSNGANLPMFFVGFPAAAFGDGSKVRRISGRHAEPDPSGDWQLPRGFGLGLGFIQSRQTH